MNPTSSQNIYNNKPLENFACNDGLSLEQRTNSRASEILNKLSIDNKPLSKDRIQNETGRGLLSLLYSIFCRIINYFLGNVSTSTETVNLSVSENFEDLGSNPVESDTEAPLDNEAVKDTFIQAFTAASQNDDYVDPRFSTIERKLKEGLPLEDIKKCVLEQVWKDFTRAFGTDDRVYKFNGKSYGMHNAVGETLEEKEENMLAQISCIHDEVLSFLKDRRRDQSEEKLKLLTLYVMANMHQGGGASFNIHAVKTCLNLNVMRENQVQLNTGDNDAFEVNLTLDESKGTIVMTKSYTGEIIDNDIKANRKSSEDYTIQNGITLYSKKEQQPYVFFKMQSRCEDLATKLLDYMDKRQPLELHQRIEAGKCVAAYQFQNRVKDLTDSDEDIEEYNKILEETQESIERPSDEIPEEAIEAQRKEFSTEFFDRLQ